MIKTIALSGEGTISLDKTEKFVWLRNMSADDISVSADGEEYATVEAGHSLRLEAPPERVLYFRGSGDVEMYSSNVPESPYRVAGSSGGGGGSAVLGTKNVTENGVYNASSDGYDGYSRVTVNVSASPDVGEKNITANGTYTAADDSLDGYDIVNVNVPAGYVFPQGTSYDDIIELTGGSGIIHDTTDNAYMYVVVDDNEHPGYRSFNFMLHKDGEDVRLDGDSTMLIEYNAYISGLKIIDSSTGKWAYQITWYAPWLDQWLVNNWAVKTSSGLAGLFSDSSHIYSIENIDKPD